MMKMPKDKRFLAAIVVLVLLVLYVILGYNVKMVPLPSFMPRYRSTGKDGKGKATTKRALKCLCLP